MAGISITLSEIFRVLKVGGRLLLTTPNPLDIKKRIRSESVLDAKAHVSQHFPDALILKLKMMGFSSLKIYGSGKVTRYLGYYFPWLNIYGSYLMTSLPLKRRQKQAQMSLRGLKTHVATFAYDISFSND
ncbi:MAG: hypothetical protein AAFW70_09175 [Cyanobacteria bacterium J06635_10]